MPAARQSPSRDASRVNTTARRLGLEPTLRPGGRRESSSRSENTRQWSGPLFFSRKHETTSPAPFFCPFLTRRLWRIGDTRRLNCSFPLFWDPLYFLHRKSDKETELIHPSQGNQVAVSTKRLQAVENLGRSIRKRLEPSRGQRPGRPSDPLWVVQRKVSMMESTLQQLEEIASQVSNDTRRVSPMQIAAVLLEEALSQTFG